MPSYPLPDPPINLPIGVGGSLERVLATRLQDNDILMGAPKPLSVKLSQRPTQLAQYPCVVIIDSGTGRPEYNMENGKQKTYNYVIEVYALSRADAERLGMAVERVLETNGPDEATSAIRQIASWSMADPDGVSILDLGGERYEEESRDWSASGAQRTHRGTLPYAIEIMRQF